MKKLNEIDRLLMFHSLIMLKILGNECIYKLTENWTKEDHNHFEHSTENIRTQMKMFDRQITVAYEAVAVGDFERIERSLDIFKKDRETLRKNLQFGRIQITVEILLDYINSLNTAITLFETTLLSWEY